MPVKIELEETIAAPPERVFDALTDLEMAPAWMPGLIELEKLTQGPFSVGTRWREVRRFIGHRSSETFEVTRSEPNEALEVFCDGKNGTSKGGHFRFSYTLSPEGSETRLKLTTEISQLGWFGELMGRLFAGPYKSMIARELRAMKSFIEAPASESVAPQPLA
jgi:uncharacterized protein YndB with AHSA1/START domain